jgi:hypothetical protein
MEIRTADNSNLSADDLESLIKETGIIELDNKVI